MAGDPLRGAFGPSLLAIALPFHAIGAAAAAPLLAVFCLRTHGNAPNT